MRLAGVAALLLAVAAPAGAQTAPEARRDAFTVTYRSATSVYVAAGRAAGLAVGDRLAVMDGTRSVAELEVLFVAEHSSSSRIVRETRAVKVGDRVTRAGGPPPTAPTDAGRPAPPPATTAAPAPPGGSPPLVRSYQGDAPIARVTGGVSAGWSNFEDASDTGRDNEERMLRYGVAFRELGGQAVDFTVRGSHRQSLREGRRTTIVPADERWDRLYEASLAWAPAGRPFAVRAGRLGAQPFSTMGYLDGILGDFRPMPALQVGAFAGRVPDVEDVGFDGGPKYGGFVRLAAGSAPVAYDLLVSGTSERAGGEPSRQYLGQEVHVRSGRLWVHERVEVDLNRDWRRERAGSGVQLSDGRLLVSWRNSPTRSLSATYERHRNFWTAFNRSVPEALFDDRIYQTWRADAAFSRPGGTSFWVGGSVRTREGDEDPAYAAHAGARTAGLGPLESSADVSAYRTLYTRGLLATLRTGRTWGAGPRADLSYTLNAYDLLADGPLRIGHWVRLSGYGPFVRQAFVRADVEYAFGDDVKGLRLLIETGYRF